MRAKILFLVASLALVAACSADRFGWARRGSFWKLHETETLQVRRGPQVLDPKTKEIALHWVGARALPGEPAILACDLVVFLDRDGDGKPATAEIVSVRESRDRCDKVLFDDVRALPSPGIQLRALLHVRTEAEECEVGWVLAPD